MLKIIRKILLLTINTEWANDLKELLEKNSKVEVDVATTRTVATKTLTDKDIDAVIVEDTFKLKNMDYFLRTLTTQNIHPKFVYFFFSEFSLFNTVSIPEELSKTAFRAHSLPMTREMVVDIVFNDLFPYGAESSGSFDREFTQVLIKSTTRVIDTFGLTSLKVGKPNLLSKMDETEGASIRGKIIIKSEFFKGSLFISFPTESYINLYKTVVDDSVTEINDSNKDFAGELANMIYGHSKKELEEHGVKLDMAIPVVDESDTITSSSPIYVIPIESSIGKFYVKLAPNVF